MPCVVMGITGGIAAYKACDVVSRLKKAGCDVYCIMTRHATEFVSPLTFETLSGHPVVVDMFDREAPWEVEHISLAQRADVFLVAPATANVLAKMAHGIADDMLTSTLLATRAPIICAPAMNTGMYENVATQANIRLLESRGVQMVGPDAGILACGDIGRGRMTEPPVIVDAVLQRLEGKNDLAGRHVVVTAGPTREPLDPVRYITNRSSGKMGYAIARAAAARGARVTLVSGPVNLPVPYGVTRVDVTTTEDMLQALMEVYDEADVVIKAAAPADYRAAEVAEQKIKKHPGDEGMTLRLVENPDIARTLGERKTHQVLVVFAAETEKLTEHAQGKLLKKHADLMVANDVTRQGAGFDTDTNEVTIMDREGGVEQVPMMSKDAVAHRILDRAAALMQA